VVVRLPARNKSETIAITAMARKMKTRAAKSLIRHLQCPVRERPKRLLESRPLEVPLPDLQVAREFGIVFDRLVSNRAIAGEVFYRDGTTHAVRHRLGARGALMALRAEMVSPA
jgi:hypothetical protein